MATSENANLNSRLAVDLVVQAVPPADDAIGEYTACLANELQKSLEVRILTNADAKHDAIPNVEIDSCFHLSGGARFNGLFKSMLSTNANAIVLQYNPFAWGRRGWAPDLVNTFSRIKKLRPEITIGVMFHEIYMMNPGFRSWVMRQYQRRQFHRIASLADICFFSTGRWAEREIARRPAADIVHLPVGSNLPGNVSDTRITREHWGIQPNDFVCGVFGGAHASRLMSWIELAVEQIAKSRPSGRRVVLLHVGREKIDWTAVSTPVVSTGRLNAEEAAQAIAAMDVLINPFSEGFSTRRTSAIAALQQGVPVLSTYGPSTDETLMHWDGRAIFLAPVHDPAAWPQSVETCVSCIQLNSESVHADAKRLYDEIFTWSSIGNKMIDFLNNKRRKKAVGALA